LAFCLRGFGPCDVHYNVGRRHRREERIVSVELSEDARKLWRQVVALAGEYPRGEVPDRILWEGAELNPDAYYDAAEQLVAHKLAESSQGTDFAVLKATPKGMQLAR
jgi:hypothetical protein